MGGGGVMNARQETWAYVSRAEDKLAFLLLSMLAENIKSYI